MAKDTFATAKNKASFNTALDNNQVTEESITFIRDNDIIHTHNKDYQALPSSGTEGQILTMVNGSPQWTDLNLLDLYTYGVEWNSTVNEPFCTRIGNMEYHRTLPIQSQMKGCIYDCINKKVVYWLDDSDWRFAKIELHASLWYPSYNKEIKTDTDGRKYLYIESTATNTTDRISYAEWFNERYIKYIVNDITVLGKYSYKIENNRIYSRVDIETEVDDNTATKYLTALKNYLFSANAYNIGIIIGSRLDGYDGEVMVYVPEFWIKSFSNDNIRSVRVSIKEIDDTWMHQPAIYMSAYKSTILGSVPTGMNYLSKLPKNAAVTIVNSNTYCRGGNGYNTWDSSEDIYRRNLGKPATNGYRSLYRTYARSAGKELISYAQYRSVIVWLCIIEYGTTHLEEPFNSELDDNGFKQGGLGSNMYCVNADFMYSYNKYNPIATCGCTNSLGNNSGFVTFETQPYTYTENGAVKEVPSMTFNPIRYRGIEIPFGEYSTVLDGNIMQKATGSTTTFIWDFQDPKDYTDTVSAGNVAPSGSTLVYYTNNSNITESYGRNVYQVNGNILYTDSITNVGQRPRFNSRQTVYFTNSRFLRAGNDLSDTMFSIYDDYNSPHNAGSKYGNYLAFRTVVIP